MKPAADKIAALLQSPEEEVLINLLNRAQQCRRENIGNTVYLRGLIEFSNYCDLNCLYCGLRKNNYQISRYHLTLEQVVDIARQAYQNGFHSLALQSGQVNTSAEFRFILDAVKAIKDFSSQEVNGSLGITLSVGELSYQQYKTLWEAGAHRYLLRIETSDPVLFNRIHPSGQRFSKRLECLDSLKDIGYQVGTGVMIGLPGQTYESLAEDLLFFEERDIDMLGMGPYIIHPGTPLAKIDEYYINDPYITTLKMMALARLLMPDINMVASTALQTIHPAGLTMGLKAGANIVMPVLTPGENRSDYSIYANKVYKDLQKISQEIEQSGNRLALWQWGDSRHYYRRLNLPYPDQSSLLSHEVAD
ncbi:[FeFe]-hydrogenase maturation HydE, radical SAM [Syntrophomonas zehnderi OL-4]|uniref:[FeFe]-hydrogenase maturation HydE, radical SAM n=1 Tax=Syntrophomonas zehnderi OL-4 TaxID=690567 RepID=A0A0E4GCE8_9FIRM|nr:[FeFe] hydrogenase H-cluster radical SAM maturase HydE [Syntrophomonas zehnderi]CFY11594.1 [FeFe]-hydrogenase maturation HydE, radical SAM [Syntrophomonas zehnderi OL-4]